MARLSSPFQKVEGMAPVATRLIEAYQNMPGGQLALYQLLKNAGISDYNIYKYLQHPFTPHTIGQIQKDITEKEGLITEGMTEREKEIYKKYGEEFTYRYKMERTILAIGENTSVVAEYLRNEQEKILKDIAEKLGVKFPKEPTFTPGETQLSQNPQDYYNPKDTAFRPAKTSQTGLTIRVPGQKIGVHFSSGSIK
jgi:hypothetical protein